eukprot:6181214-Pleurochrysis_carterae.AAC.2
MTTLPSPAISPRSMSKATIAFHCQPPLQHRSHRTGHTSTPKSPLPNRTRLALLVYVMQHNLHRLSWTSSRASKRTIYPTSTKYPPSTHPAPTKYPIHSGPPTSHQGVHEPRLLTHLHQPQNPTSVKQTTANIVDEIEAIHGL